MGGTFAQDHAGNPIACGSPASLAVCWCLEFYGGFSHSLGRQALGEDDFSVLADGQQSSGAYSAERYDPLTGTWTSIAAMSTRRRYVRVATLGG